MSLMILIVLLRIAIISSIHPPLFCSNTSQNFCPNVILFMDREIKYSSIRFNSKS